MIHTLSRLLRRVLCIAGVALFGVAPLGIAAAHAAEAQKKILYVTRLDLPANASERNKELQQKGMASDTKVRMHLEAMGYAVTFADQSAPPADAEKYDLVILSSVVQSRQIADTAYKDVRVPLLTWENDLFDSLRLTGRKKGEVYGEVEKEHYIRIVNAPHPLAAGIPAGKTYVYPRDTSMGWGTPARSLEGSGIDGSVMTPPTAACGTMAACSVTLALMNSAS
jgi:hypothetical protein